MLHLVMAMLLAALFLGCGNQGAGVSTESHASKDTKQGSQLERTQTLSVEKKTVANVIVPVSPLIGEAWGELVREEKNMPDQATCEGMWHAPLSAIREASEDETRALLCAFKLGYYYAFMPTMGWPVEPKSDKGASYRLRTLAHVLSVNNLASDIAAEVTTTSYQSPLEAKAAIKQLLMARRAYLRQLYYDSFDLHLMSGSIDMTGPKDVMFSKGAYHMTLGAGGAVIKYSGVDWFGNGNLSGKRYELQLASMTGVAMSKGKTVTDGSEQKVGEGDKTQAGVGK